MKCPQCQLLNPDHARFCAQCGSPMPDGQPAGTLQPAPPSRSLWGLPLHFWLFIACAVAVLAIFLPWYSTQSHTSVSWKTTGYEYSDGSRSTWQVPETSTSYYGGGSGANVLTILLAGAIGGLAAAFRGGVWPRWSVYTLAVAVVLTPVLGLINLAEDANAGPALFALAGVLAMPATYRLLRSR